MLFIYINFFHKNNINKLIEIFIFKFFNLYEKEIILIINKLLFINNIYIYIQNCY